MKGDPEKKPSTPNVLEFVSDPFFALQHTVIFPTAALLTLHHTVPLGSQQPQNVCSTESERFSCESGAIRMHHVITETHHHVGVISRHRETLFGSNLARLIKFFLRITRFLHPCRIGH